MKKVFSWLQTIGKALMLPISILPVAGILYRIGQPDILNIPIIMNAGGTLFDNLPLLFAIGIAFGLAKDSHGSAALAGAVSYFVLNASAQAVNYAIQAGTIFAIDDVSNLNEIKLLHFGGIIAGIIGGLCYNKYHNTKLPDVLGFFGGRRFVPLMTGLFSLIVGVVLGFVWNYVDMGLNTFSNWMVISGGIGAFVYGVLNRLLIPFGLHHIINTFVWFMSGTFTDPSGHVYSGDITRFMHLDPTGGTFTAGFFPIIMFGLPAAALAMLACSKKSRRKEAAGILLSTAFVALLTGITEPLEFSFIFLAPVLFAFHCVMMGLSLAICQILNIHIAFTFSAGLFDYVLNWGIAQKPFLIIPLGLAFAVLYFLVFYFIIKKMDLKTIGREDDNQNSSQTTNSEKSTDLDEYAKEIIEYIGGKSNIEQLDSCITRLRLVLKDQSLVDEAKLKQAGASGVMKIGDNATQVIVGTKAELICDAMKKQLNN